MLCKYTLQIQTIYTHATMTHWKHTPCKYILQPHSANVHCMNPLQIHTTYTHTVNIHTAATVQYKWLNKPPDFPSKDAMCHQCVQRE